MDKKILVLLMFVLVAFIAVVPCVYAENKISTDFPDSSGSVTNVDKSVKKVWGTVTTVVQILAFGAVVFAGLRYMFASADQKADIKKGLGMLTIGAILVFAASTVVKFVASAAGDILK